MAFISEKKRKPDGAPRIRMSRRKKLKLQRNYSSESSDESETEGKFIARDAPKADPTIAPPLKSKRSTTQKADRRQSKSSQKPAPQSDLQEDQAKNGKHDGLPRDESQMNALSGSDEDITDASNSDSFSEDDSDANSEAGNDASAQQKKGKRAKRRDPTAFAASLTAILSSKLPSSKRVDPVLSRSKDAQKANHEVEESKLESKAKRKMRDEKRQASEKGRIKDVLLGDRSDVSLLPGFPVEDASTGPSMTAAEIAEQERRLRKTAQRGVVKLFNAVRAAQVKGEEEARLSKENGVVGSKQRKDRVGEMSRNAFLDLVAGGGATK